MLRLLLSITGIISLFIKLGSSQYNTGFNIRNVDPSEGQGYDLLENKNTNVYLPPCPIHSYYDGTALRDEKWRFDAKNKDTVVNRRYGFRPDDNSDRFYLVDSTQDAQGVKTRTSVLIEQAEIQELLEKRVDTPQTLEELRSGVNYNDGSIQKKHESEQKQLFNVGISISPGPGLNFPIANIPIGNRPGLGGGGINQQNVQQPMPPQQGFPNFPAGGFFGFGGNQNNNGQQAQQQQQQQPQQQQSGGFFGFNGFGGSTTQAPPPPSTTQQQGFLGFNGFGGFGGTTTQEPPPTTTKPSGFFGFNGFGVTTTQPPPTTTTPPQGLFGISSLGGPNTPALLGGFFNNNNNNNNNNNDNNNKPQNPPNQGFLSNFPTFGLFNNGKDDLGYNRPSYTGQYPTYPQQYPQRPQRPNRPFQPQPQQITNRPYYAGTGTQPQNPTVSPPQQNTNRPYYAGTGSQPQNPIVSPPQPQPQQVTNRPYYAGTGTQPQNPTVSPPQQNTNRPYYAGTGSQPQNPIVSPPQPQPQQVTNRPYYAGTGSQPQKPVVSPQSPASSQTLTGGSNPPYYAGNKPDTYTTKLPQPQLPYIPTAKPATSPDSLNIFQTSTESPIYDIDIRGDFKNKSVMNATKPVNATIPKRPVIAGLPTDDEEDEDGVGNRIDSNALKSLIG